MQAQPDSDSVSVAETRVGAALKSERHSTKGQESSSRPMIVLPLAFRTCGVLRGARMDSEITDDAFVDANIVFIVPRVSGNVIALHVNDNQMVSQGDPLFEIDPSIYQAAVNQDEQTVISDEAKAASQQASYEQSVTHVQTLKAIFESTKASTAQARATAAQMSDDLARNKALATTGVTSRPRYDDSSKPTLAAIANLNSKSAQQDSAAAYEAEAGKQMQSAKAQWDSGKAAIGEAQAALAQEQLPAFLHKSLRSSDGPGNGAIAQFGRLRAGRSTSDGSCARERVDHRQLQRESANRPCDPARRVKIRCGRLSRPHPAWPRRYVHSGRRPARSFTAFSTRKRNRQFRKDRATRAGQDRSR